MFNIIKDKRGSLMPIEFSKLSFIPVRVFSVFDVPKGEIRGNHSHYNTIQLIICIKGEVIVGLDHGNRKEEIKILPGQSVLVDKLVWDWQKFLTGDDHILVLCSTNFDKNDYIEDRENFYKIKKII
jgi:quercetin dioxygenase-like cupin family protein